MTGLRERKKIETRQHIADVAARLFGEHGFDEVTVDQVAHAADVAKKTVFNYFPTKEDLVFDRAEAREQDIVALVRDRAPDVPLVTAFHDRVLEFLARVAEHEPGFRRVSAMELAKSSPTLLRKSLEIRERQARVLAAEIAAAEGVDEWDPVANTVARALLTAHWSVLIEVHRGIMAGATPAEAATAARVAADRVFAMLAGGLADYPTDRPAATNRPAPARRRVRRSPPTSAESDASAEPRSR